MVVVPRNGSKIAEKDGVQGVSNLFRDTMCTEDFLERAQLSFFREHVIAHSLAECPTQLQTKVMCRRSQVH